MNDKFEITIEFKDDHEAFFFSKMLQGLSEFIRTYSQTYTGDYKPANLILNIADQISDKAFYSMFPLKRPKMEVVNDN